MGSIELTTDWQFIADTLNEPEMMERISEHGQDIAFDDESVKELGELGYLLGWYVDGQIMGFYWVHPAVNTSCLQIHAHFPKANRAFAKGSGSAMLKWLDHNAPGQIRKYMAMIPECYPDVIGFSAREGLKVEGMLTKAFNKGGNMLNLHILGAEREYN